MLNNISIIINIQCLYLKFFIKEYKDGTLVKKMFIVLQTEII